MEKEIVKHFDLNSFWKEDEYALREYMETFPDDELIASIGQELEYKLPVPYIELMRIQNGGFPKNDCYPTTEPTCWADDHITLKGFLAIGHTKSHSLCGALGSRFWIDEWGYPDDGVYICDCPSGGHDMILLDYTNNGNDGEPTANHKITSWKEFIDQYPQMVTLGNNEITTHGYAKGFVEDWFNERLRTGAITKRLWSGYQFSETYHKKWLQ